MSPRQPSIVDLVREVHRFINRVGFGEIAHNHRAMALRFRRKIVMEFLG
jgi:hypothetical protein